MVELEATCDAITAAPKLVDPLPYFYASPPISKALLIYISTVQLYLTCNRDTWSRALARYQQQIQIFKAVGHFWERWAGTGM
ncbi:MAG: hypothetical protein ACREUM_08360 [Nitrosospira sp.]